ncbi:MAG TPA: PASTA domain-containing protein [Acidimicrobiia bacterium]|nr:PASTA domain-containing protein [Acidimicrobiia bacterium]
MSFVGGALVGGVLGLGAGALLGRRNRSDRTNLGAVAVTLAAVALIASGIAIARSGGHGPTTRATSAPTTSTAPPAPSTPTPTSTTIPSVASTESVPNVVGQRTATATATLEHLGLRATVETLALANVPAGFVISQSPLPAALVPPGTAVSLVVSSAT